MSGSSRQAVKTQAPLSVGESLGPVMKSESIGAVLLTVLAVSSVRKLGLAREGNRERERERERER